MVLRVLLPLCRLCYKGENGILDNVHLLYVYNIEIKYVKSIENPNNWNLQH